MDLSTTIIWTYSYGTGMIVAIFGIATGSMAVSYAKIKDTALFAEAYKTVMTLVIFESLIN